MRVWYQESSVLAAALPHTKHRDIKEQAVPTCSLLHLHEDKGTNLAGRIELPMSLHPGVPIGGTDNLKRNVLTENNKTIKHSA